MRGCKTLAISALALIAAAQAAVADGRDNPFKRPPTELELQAAQDERTRGIVREMIPEIERTVMRQVERRVSESEVRTKRRIDELGATLTSIETSIEELKKKGVAASGGQGGDAAAPDENTSPEVADNKIPADATFISCVNGKAIYRAKDKIITIDASEAPSDVGCAG